MNFAVVLQNGDSVEVEEAELEHDLVSNSLIFRFSNGTYSKFYWPYVAYFVAVS